MNTKTITKNHRDQAICNQTLLWMGIDSKERWTRHMQNPEQRQQLIKYGFDQPDSITYKINSHGFRSDEFDGSPGFIALGCSFTSGVGLPVEQIWPTMVAGATGLKSWNLGIGGCGLDTCFRMLYNYIDVLNPKFVMLLIPDVFRFEIHHLGTPVMVMHTGVPHNSDIEIIKKFYYSDEQNSTVNLVKNMLAINQICQNRQIKLIAKPLYPTLENNKLSVNNTWPAARDLAHVGYLEQRFCADQFLKDLDQN